MNSGGDNRDELLSALAFWVEAGVDTLVEPEARDWRQVQAPELPQPSQPTEIAPPPALAAASSDVTAATIADLRAAVETFTGCPLRTPGVNTVFADGNPAADLMLIGEAPGVEEDRQGLPFLGPAGQLLNRMLAAIGRDRTSAYITNVTFWRPPGNRTPTVDEVESCLPFVRRHIALARPKVVVALGAVSARALTGDASGIMRMRGEWRSIEIEGTAYPLMPTIHPAYLLRQPEAKRLSWADLLSVKAKLDAD